MGLTLDLARAAQAIRHADLPPRAVHAARVSLADGLATMAAAVRLEPCAAPFHAHALAAGPGPSTLLAGGRAQPAMAALANGALAHALDFEDTFDAAGLHPNAAAIPAVLALAEAEDARVGDVLAALAVGCDVACRLGLALAADPGARGWYYPPMIGGIGATVAVAHLLRLTPEQTVAAVSLAACQFALTDELKRSPASDLRAVRDGLAARAAVEAALLARAGVVGTGAPLEGEAGLFATLTGQGPAGDPLAGFGTRFLGEEVSLKPWPCCRGTHPFVALGLALRDQGLAGDAVASVAVTVRPPDDMLLLPVADRQRPRTAIAARFSIPFTFAHALLRGAPTLASFLPAGLADAPVLALAARVALDRVGRDATPGLRMTLVDGATVERPAPPLAPWTAGTTDLATLAPKLADCLAIAEPQALAFARTIGALPPDQPADTILAALPRRKAPSPGADP